MKTPELVKLARDTAARHDLRPELVCAVIEQESGWNEFAHRYEPAFYEKYVPRDALRITEARSRAFSWGLMQVMGQVARELGFKGVFLSELCAPANGVEYGCRKLARCMANAEGDEGRALLLYNGGGNKEYPQEVLARITNYRGT